MSFLTPFVALCVLAALDRVLDSGHVWRVVRIRMLAGLLAAVSCDIFRLPFVFAREWGYYSHGIRLYSRGWSRRDLWS
jgi:hypothetical protein